MTQGGGPDRVRRAYAILGLKPDATLPEVRRRHRFLVQRWHPDRHAADVRNQAEAGAEMQRINEAYQVVVESLAPAPAASDPSPEQGRRLTREEIDALASAIQSESAVERVLAGIGWVGTTLEGIVAVVFGAGLAMRVALGFWRGDFREQPVLLVGMALLGGLVFRELWLRSRVARGAFGKPAAPEARASRSQGASDGRQSALERRREKDGDA